MASTEPTDPLTDLDDEVHVPTGFEVRARYVALVWPLVLIAVGLPGTRFLGGDAGRELGEVFLSALALATALPSLPLLAALPIVASPVVLLLGAVTSLPVWMWAGAALARRVQRSRGPDWGRWAGWYLTFPLVAVAFAVLFIAGLTPN
ncbi:MAG TPA: hypothetical protein VGA69_08185 [Nitriliruptorales bacterium]